MFGRKKKKTKDELFMGGGLSQESHSLPPFEKLFLRGEVQANLIESEEFKVTVRRDKELHKDRHVEFEVKNNALYLDVFRSAEVFADKNSAGSRVMVDIYCKNKDLSEVDVCGACLLKAGLLMSKTLSIWVRGASKMNLQSLTSNDVRISVKGASGVNIEDIRAEEVIVAAEGASNVKMSGIVKKLLLKLQGASSFDSGNLKVYDMADISLEGVSTTKVFCSGDLFLDAGGCSMVQTFGGANVVKQKLSRMAKVSNQ